MDTSTYLLFIFFLNDTATTAIYTLSLHDALPIYEAEPMLFERRLDGINHVAQVSVLAAKMRVVFVLTCLFDVGLCLHEGGDRKSTRLNSSHVRISYAVFCLKKKKINQLYTITLHI